MSLPQNGNAHMTVTAMDTPATAGNSGAEVNQLQNPKQVGQSNKPDDLKYISDLSTLLVATIQDAKDQISQVEYIFCSQLYPTFQKNSKSLQKLYLEVRKATEDEWKETHLKMVNQVDELYLEKKQALADKADLLMKISELEEKLLFKDVEIEKEKEWHYKLQKVIESKSSDLDNKQMQLGLYEERLSSLFTNMKELEEEKYQLKEELGKNNEHVNKGKELQEEILKHVSSQGKKILRMEELLQCQENERKNLVLKLENVEASLNNLTSEYGMRIIELEECRKSQKQLVQKNDAIISELSNKEQLLCTHKKEKRLLLSRLKDLENKIEELPESASKDRNVAVPEASEYYRHLEQQLQSKDYELLTEKQKRKDLLNAYKSLKSQYNYLCVRSGLTAENKLPKPKVEVENEPPNHNANRNLTSACTVVAGGTTKEKEISSGGNSEEDKYARSNQTTDAAGKMTEVKKEMSESTSDDDDRVGRMLNQASLFDAPFTSNAPAASKWKTSRSSSSSAGGKRPTSDWRETRSRQGPNGPDPHDDFLNTPLENIRSNLTKALQEEVHNTSAPVSGDMECDDLDDETEQNINAEPVLQKQQLPQALRRSPNEFKYVEPVRKKAQRESLKGVECKQCKKFYDAVLPDGENKDTGDGKKAFRCEHLDGVSRHRYRYAPPMTPEGFWNIGFDSEI